MKRWMKHCAQSSILPAISNDPLMLELSYLEAAGGELNILLTAPGFLVDGQSAQALPLEIAIKGKTSQYGAQSATFNLVALRPGKANIKIEFYCGDLFKRA